MIPFPQRKPMETSGLRIGTPAVTTRGMRAEQMPVIAGLIHRTLSSNGDPNAVARVRTEVREMCDHYKMPGE